MYCKKCGTQIPDDAKYCQVCGTNQQQGEKPPKFRGFILGVIVCAVVFLAGISLFGGEKEEDSEKDVELQIPVTETTEVTPPETEEAAAVVQEPTAEMNAPPENGWHEANGKRYYYENGEKLTGLQEIKNVVYFFREDGTLATDPTVEINGNTLYIEKDGRVDGIQIGYVSGEWAESKYRFGNGGSSSILELDMDIENCTRMDFYLEANGLRGAKVNGTWKVYVRSNGSWIFAKTINYSEPSGIFEIKFDTPTDFDAVTAYPTVQGNASYSSGFLLTDVYMEF